MHADSAVLPIPQAALDRYSKIASEAKFAGPAGTKPFATAQARCALWRGTLSCIDGDDGRPLFIITRWSLTRAFTDLAEVERFLDLIGAPR